MCQNTKVCNNCWNIQVCNNWWNVPKKILIDKMYEFLIKWWNVQVCKINAKVINKMYKFSITDETEKFATTHRIIFQFRLLTSLT